MRLSEQMREQIEAGAVHGDDVMDWVVIVKELEDTVLSLHGLIQTMEENLRNLQKWLKDLGVKPREEEKP